VAEFAAALRLGNKPGEEPSTDFDEVECFLANLIYKVRNSTTLLSCSSEAHLTENGAY
jgi:hypothetical protein